MSYLDRTRLSGTGWIFCCSVKGYRAQNGYIALYNNPNCTPFSVINDTISQNMSLTRSRYCKLRISETLPDEPCLYMFVAYNEQCQIQVELVGLHTSLDQGVVQIVEDDSNFAKLTFPSISKSIAVALENNQRNVYLYYWPLKSVLSYSRDKFLSEHPSPIWDDR